MHLKEGGLAIISINLSYASVINDLGILAPSKLKPYNGEDNPAICPKQIARVDPVIIRSLPRYAIAMTKKLTWLEILESYKDEWVELVDYKWDLSEPTPAEGVVRVHSADRNKFNQMISEDPAADSAVIFAGKISLPENTYLHANLRVSQK